MERIGRIVAQALVGVCVLAVCGCLVVGCGGKDEPKGTSGKTDGGKAAPAAGKPSGEAPKPAVAAEPAGPLTPAQWSDSTVACYQAALKDTIAALDGTPPADQALPKMKAVREKCIEQLVPLGKQREAMTPAARAQTDSACRPKLMALQSSDDFKTYLSLATGPYSDFKARTDTEKELAKLIAGINIITQYAHFELLKKQEPKEAERLGIK